MSKGNQFLTEINLQQKQQIPSLDPNLKHELLKSLEPDILTKIKKSFDLFKKKVSIDQFVVIMVEVLFQQHNWKKYKKEVITFVELYLLINLNNTEKIKFEDFTNYLIDRDEGDEAEDECQFMPAQSLNSLELTAENVFPLENSQNLAILSNNKKSIQILQKKSYKSLETISIGSIVINNIIFIQGYNIYCLATNDKHLNFYQNVDNTLVRRFSLPDTIIFMMTYGYDSKSYRLICASTNGHIYEFSIEKILLILEKKNKEKIREEETKRKEYPPEKQYKYFMLNGKITQNEKGISCVDVMEALDILVTGSNDSLVRLYEMRQAGLHLIKQLDGHYKGIKGIAVSVHFKLVVSCSFDFDVLVWNAYLEHPVARLEGHQAPLTNVCCPKKHQVIISMDSKSNMKIWSSQNYHLIQNFIIFENFPLNTSINLIYKHQSDLAIVWTKKMKFFEYLVSYNPKLTDDQDVTAIRYSSKNLEVYIGSRMSLKVWSIKQGTQIKNYKNIVNSQISIIEIDDRERRCFVGTIDGEIVSIDIFSGLVINKFSSHSQQITMLMYFNEKQLLISGGWDKRIKIHNDTHHLEKIQSRENVLRNINNISEKDLGGGSFSAAQMCIATHCKTNNCRIWDFEKGFLQAEFILPNGISLISFIDPLPILIIIDVKGTVYMFSTKNLVKKPYQLLCQWKNMYSIQKSSQITFISSVYEQSSDKKSASCELTIGDQYGYIRVIDISEFLLENEIQPVSNLLLGNKNPYRIEDYNYIGSSQNSSNTFDYSTHQSSNIVPPPSIKQKIQIKAHNEKVNYIALVKESSEPLILSSGSDHLVKIWNYDGQPRGTMRQGIKQNKNWNYQMDKNWSNRETIQYRKIQGKLSDTFEDYLIRKRMEVIPFSQEIKQQEINNDEIYKDLREVEAYLSKYYKKSVNRLY